MTTPEQQIEKLNASYSSLNRYERLLLERPWLKSARISPTLEAMREQLQMLIDQNIPVQKTEEGFKIQVFKIE